MTIHFDREKCHNLTIGVIGIYFFYCVASVLQEWIMKKPYINRFTNEPQYFQNTNAFILVPSLIAWGIGSILNRQNYDRTVIPKKNLVYCSGLMLITTLAFTQAIYLTSFPIVMMFKSCNVLSVLTVGIFCSRVSDKSQKLGSKKLITGILITIGIILYNFGGNKHQTQKATNMVGILLLFISLLCDGFLPDFQAEVKTKFQPTPLEMFEDMNRWKFYLALIWGMINFECISMVQFFWAHPLCLVNLVMLALLGSMGQMIVYWMIKLFKQHIVPFTITTRKLATVLISILFFGHQTTLWQLLGILLVFVVVVADFTSQITKQRPPDIEPSNGQSFENEKHPIAREDPEEEINVKENIQSDNEDQR